MIVVQTRQIAIDHYSRTDRLDVPWQEAARFVNWSTAHQPLRELMAELGFVPYYEIPLLIDDLKGWQREPEKNILTTDEGAEIRVLTELSCMSCIEVDDQGTLHTGVMRGTVAFGEIVSGRQTYKLTCGHITI